MAATVDITDEVMPILKAFSSAMRRSVAPAIGAAVVLLFQQNFLSLGTNQQNFPSTGFWAGAARSCNYDVLADGVQINVNQQGVRQRLQGGEIHAKPGHYLTIPARAEAYGKRAGEFTNLHAVFFKTSHGFFAALAENQSQDVSFGRKKKDGSRTVKPGEERGGGVLFWLVRSVKQAGNPNVIPSADEIESVALATVLGIAERAQQRGGAR